ncbi:MAG: hypothetical protein R2825_31465 [Saprospiraceae bacterium]
MKFLQHLLTALAFLSAVTAFSQIPTKGDFKIGDTTQVHKISTWVGDTFTGRVVGYDEALLFFLYRDNKLIFNVEEIKLIEVVDPKSLLSDENAQEVESHQLYFDYEITSLDSAKHFGKLSKLNGFEATLKQGLNGYERVRYFEISEITLRGKRNSDSSGPLDEYHLLRTKNGDRFTGQLLYLNQEELGFLLKNGSKITVKKDDFVDLNLVNPQGVQTSSKTQTTLNHNYNQQRLFFSPSALLLEKDVSEYRTMILYNTIEHGLSDNVTVGAGFFTVLIGHALTGKIKVGGSIGELFHFAAGAQGAYAFTFYEGDEGSETLGLVYGSIAIGTKDRFLNASIGRGKSPSDSEGTTAFSFGGSFRTGNHWRVYVEYLNFIDNYYSYYDRENTIMGTFGLSWFRGQHQVDFGIYLSNELGSGTAGFPVAAYNYKF